VRLAAGKSGRLRRFADASGRGLSLDEQCTHTHPRSRALDDQACDISPSGVTHAQGSRQWDVDGHGYIDYAMGHGALLLGHYHPPVTQAVPAQVTKGTDDGACHALEVAWGTD
jgi:glutamate-1-semialdehyde 2,1-aminomutase